MFPRPDSKFFCRAHLKLNQFKEEGSTGVTKLCRGQDTWRTTFSYNNGLPCTTLKKGLLFTLTR